MNIETHSNIYNLLYSIKLRELKIERVFLSNMGTGTNDHKKMIIAI